MILKLLILSNSVENKDFSKLSVNPGVGGTEYLTVLLASLFAKKNPDIDVLIYSKHNFSIQDDIKNLSVVQFNDINEIFNYVHNESDKWVLTVNSAWELKGVNALAFFDEFILWSHHPSDWRAAYLKKHASATVSTGLYQYCSNSYVNNKHFLIPNLFLKLSRKHKEDKRTTSANFNVMYLGALIPAKGFHVLLLQWSKVLDLIPNAKLHVLGGSSLYHNEPIQRSVFPCNVKYSHRLERIIKKNEIDMDSIVIHGTLGNERFDIYNRMDVAVINPTGKSESFSFNLHECFDHGIPVVTSQDYGLNDVMKHFKPQVLSSPKHLAERLHEVGNDPSFQSEFKSKAQNYLTTLEKRNETSLDLWRDLLLNHEIQPAPFKLNLVLVKGYLRSLMIYPKVLLYRLIFKYYR